MNKTVNDTTTKITLFIGDGRGNSNSGDSFYLTFEIDDNNTGVEIYERSYIEKEQSSLPRYWLRDVDEVREFAWALSVMADKIDLANKK
jgi:hypothetical protein